MSDLASVPSDVGGIEAAVNEIKPAHLDYWFTYELAQLLAALRVSGGLWSIRTVTLPPMEEDSMYGFIITTAGEGLLPGRRRGRG